MLAGRPSSSSQVPLFVQNRLLHWQLYSMPSGWPVLHSSPSAQTRDTLLPPQLHPQSPFLMILESRLHALAVLDRVWH